jgi:serine/threonine protein phosphatase 1
MAVAIWRGGWRPAIRPVPDGHAVAAIGDVHGQDDLFAALSAALAEEMAGAESRVLVQLGDLVDRGPASIAALRRARAGAAGLQTVTLLGNHEERLLSVLESDEPEELALWLEFGGAEVALEAGVTPGAPGWRAALRAALGDDLIAWLSARPVLHRIGDLVFVHAGLDPGLPLEQQERRTLVWTRRPWLESPGPYAENVAVLHGHTPQKAVDLTHPHRINLDTGAFRTGALSGLVIVGDRMRLVQASR